ncbi:MAG: aminotransferase class I/II-fold pyridoxal phosphate-dependent enzyme [Acidimicrobiia bacterium]|nr:aminotransferase class I/II-fold pyridoxal phosphate-dependent enzyme [Acidimicrobiia bacterium]MDH4306718.1 aminotransferase class I/II-fold pyridoxal phosphate-dependent enzyme [Acidimicrobiia bacterium]MDH5292679.1 aminotransferase class I/II-fold pyridoxal phosphate-dependent enzyme [Acidimicrobiia bacterium]
MLETISEAVETPTAGGIAAAIEHLVARGSLEAGLRLPTVRQLARHLEVSPTTVASAWRRLHTGGVIETRGRAGTFVTEHTGPRRRSWLSGQPGRYRLDLSTGTPDPLLLPTIGHILDRLGEPSSESYMGPVVIPELEAAIRARLPFRPEALTVVNGAIDALDRVLAQVVRRGATVIVEDPCFPPIAELVQTYGGRLVPVPLDSEGLNASGLTEAARQAPSVLVFQPRANNPTGVSTSPRRLDMLQRFVSEIPGLFVIEDDSAGDLAADDAITLATHTPDRVAHIRSFSKSHGPDLRIAALAGPGELVEAVVERRRLGPVWTSRLLQRLLHIMLTDPTIVESVDRARVEYRQRRVALTKELAQRGIAVSGTDGINLWIPVADERDAMVALASYGIGVAPGSPFQLLPGAEPHIRLTLGVDPGDWTELAELVAEAATGAPAIGRSLV